MPDHPSRMKRRHLLIAAGSSVAALGAGSRRARAAPDVPADHIIRIAPTNVELAPGKVVRVSAYNGTVPGPVIRLPQDKLVTFEVRNETDKEDIVHWHGQNIASDVDGATEEGTPAVPAGGMRRYTFAPTPVGTRWYHSHAGAGTDLSRSAYSGEFGFFLVESASDPGRYDREVLLASHHWEGSWVSMQDIKKGPPPDNGLEVMYGAASFNDRLLGHGDPVRVREGERVLFRFLNASATTSIKVALPGHRFTVIALDGNLVPTPRSVETVTLGVAERIDAVVEMNNPGVWVLGSVDDEDRGKGLGTIIEYANRQGEARWAAPGSDEWDYTTFGRATPAAEPDEMFRLAFTKIAGGRGGYNRWNINGKSWPDADPLLVRKGRRYRLVMNNDSGDEHPVHLHRHTYEVTRIGDKPTSGVMKDTLNMLPHTTAQVDFVADNPGLTLFHCHHQDHMDEGFMTLVKYVDA